LDEVILVDILQLESADIVNRFEDIIERNFASLESEVESPDVDLYDDMYHTSTYNEDYYD
jgi:hypothetical protein|tara:strand:+ start:931 stop:1110 length:180 start_codon:yes stop_codon:yes gene_type:complete